MEFYHHTSLLVLIPQPPKIDPHLFFRPFTGQSWLWTLLAAAAVVLFSSAATSPRLPGAAWRRLAGLTHAGWFVLVHAYYCGALTMFFTRAPSIPFNTIRDVMRDDSWKLIVQDGEGEGGSELRNPKLNLVVVVLLLLLLRTTLCF